MEIAQALVATSIPTPSLQTACAIRRRKSSAKLATLVERLEMSQLAVPLLQRKYFVNHMDQFLGY